MYVQDLVSPGINIAAEISEDDANNFKHMCKVFASADFRDQTIAEYVTKISEERSTYLTITLDNSMNLTHRPASEPCKTVVPTPKCSDAVSNSKLPAVSSPNTNSNNSNDDLKLAASKELEDMMKIDTITKQNTKIEMDDILTRSTYRIKREQEILRLLTFFMTTYVPTIKFMPFGSTTYGFGETSSEFNILLSSGKY